ncbi:nicotinamide-nucleotide amidohydrolase family protein [bacterium]|nr:nicotinamide-nucleotide amidohydrolase family protein [bacterium]
MAGVSGSAPAVTVRIVAVGDELLEGRTSDTNSTRIQRALGSHAVAVRDIAVVHDRLGDVAAALDRTRPGDIVFVCGGLGSTGDDITREAIAAWADVALEWRQDVAERLAAEYARRGIVRSLEGDKQPLLPAGCEPVDNPLGTAPGLVGELRGRRVAVLPGVPQELEAMLPGTLAALQRQGALPTARPTRLWRLAQMAELAVAHLTEPVRERYRDLHWSWWLVDWGVDLRLGAGPDRADELEAAAAELDALLDDLVYAREMIDLPRVVQDHMLVRGTTLAVAESCTGGMVGAAITGQDGSSGYFRGGVVSYADRIKVDRAGVDPATLAAHGAVSRPVAEEMAQGVRARFGADYALAVTGIAGPGGGTPDKPVGTTWIALAGSDALVAGRYRFSGDRERNRRLATMAALDMVRRALVGAPIVDADRLTWGVPE